MRLFHDTLLQKFFKPNTHLEQNIKTANREFHSQPPELYITDMITILKKINRFDKIFPVFSKILAFLKACFTIREHDEFRLKYATPNLDLCFCLSANSDGLTYSFSLPL